MVHEVGGGLAHAPALATRAEAVALAGEWDRARSAAVDAGEAVGQDAAGEEVAERLFHEVGQAGAVGAPRRLTKKGLEVVPEDRAEDSLLRRPGLVSSALSGRRAGRVHSDSAWG